MSRNRLLIPNIEDENIKKPSFLGDVFMVLSTFQNSLNWFLLKLMYI
jgi:hypothetical protein